MNHPLSYNVALTPFNLEGGQLLRKIVMCCTSKVQLHFLMLFAYYIAEQSIYASAFRTMKCHLHHNTGFCETSIYQGWKPGYLALGCQFQFRCIETQMSGLSFVLVSRLLKNRFQFCLRAASVSGFQFRCKFHPSKLFYCEYELFRSSTFWRFCFMISSSSDGRVRRAIASEVVN